MKYIISKKFLYNEVLHLILLVVAVGAGGYALYHNQHQKVLDLTSKNGMLSSVNSAQNSKISDLQTSTIDLTKQNVVLQNEVDEYRKTSTTKIPQPVYSLQINSVKQYSPPALFADDTNTLLVLDVSITNSGNAAGYINPSDFIVKDNNNVAQQTLSQIFGGNQSAYLPPPQPSELSGQTIGAGDTTRGSLVFYTLTSQTSFTVKYNGQSLPITVSGRISL